MKLAALILLSPLAVFAGMCFSISALVRIALFSFLCFCWRLANK